MKPKTRLYDSRFTWIQTPIGSNALSPCRFSCQWLPALSMVLKSQRLEFPCWNLTGARCQKWIKNLALTLRKITSLWQVFTELNPRIDKYSFCQMGLSLDYWSIIIMLQSPSKQWILDSKHNPNSSVVLHLLDVSASSCLLTCDVWVINYCRLLMCLYDS